LKGERYYLRVWHNIVAWGKTAEIIEKYVTKGKEIAIEGIIFLYRETFIRDTLHYFSPLCITFKSLIFN